MIQQQWPHYRVGIGQKSHRFLPSDSSKPCIIGGLIFDDAPGLAADSDGDVVYHAMCNAISTLVGISILGGLAHDLCYKDGITDSQVYLEKALELLGRQQIVHVAIALEAKKPRFEERIPEMRSKIAQVAGVALDQVGIAATSGEGLTDFGCGDGVQCFCTLTTRAIDVQ